MKGLTSKAHDQSLMILVIFSILVFLSSPATSANLPKNAKKGQYSESYTYVLGNGLKVIVWPNSNNHSKNEASLHLVIHSGSLHEKDDQLGYAHFLEHMVFEQTDVNGHNPIKDGLKELNLELSLHANAYTTFDHTRYYLDIPNATSNRMATSLSLLARMAYKAPINRSDMQDEIGVVSEEWRRAQPEKQNYEFQRAQREFQGSRYKQRLPLGSIKSIEQVSTQALKEYYAVHYRPENATLILTGDFDLPDTIAAVEQHFSPWKTKRGKQATIYPKPKMRIGNFDVYTDVNMSGYFIWLGNVVEYKDYGTPSGEYSLHITNMVMSLLHKRMQKLATQQTNSLNGLSAGLYDGHGRYGDVGLGLYAKEKDLEPGFKLMASVMNDAKANGFSQVELDNIRDQFLVSERVQLDSATHLSNLATDHVVEGDWLRDQSHYLALLENKLPKLTLTEVNAHAGSLFKTPHKIEIISQPDMFVPDEAQVRSWIVTGKQQDAALLKTQAVDGTVKWKINHRPGTIVKRQEYENGVHKLQLSNGIDVNYRYSDSAPGKVYMQLIAPGGLNALSHQEVVNTRVGMPVISASGLQKLDGHALRAWLEAQAITLLPQFNMDSRGVYLDGPVVKVETMLQTLHVALQDAQVDPSLYDYFIPQFEQSIRDIDDLEYADFLAAFEEALSQGHPAHRSLTVAEINSVSNENMQRIYAKYMAGAQNYTLHIVGDVSLDQLVVGLKNNIASLPLNGAPLVATPTPQIPPHIRIEQQGNDSKASNVNYYLQVKRDETLSFENDVKNLGQLSRLLTKKLSLVIREELGLTYSLQANIYQTYANDPLITLGVHLECDPENVEQVITQVEKVLTSLNENGISQSDIDKDTLVLRQDFKNEQHKAKFILQQLLQGQLYQRDLSTLLSAEDAYPSTQAKTLDALLDALINHKTGSMTAILHP